MTTVEVENMTADELNSRKNELPDLVRNESDLAERYIQARLDAKQRDVVMATQGAAITEKDDLIASQATTIANLNQAVNELHSALAMKDRLIADMESKSPVEG